MPARSIPNPWLTLFAACFGLGMLMVDTFIVNVAFPAIGRSLDASLSAAEWTVSAYVLVTGVFPVAMGRLGDIFGRNRLYLAGLVLFILASGLCGLAATIEQLIAFRVLQGFGAAIMMPLTLSIVTAAFPPQRRGLAIGIWGGVSGLGLIAGPILGGLLVIGDQWRWIFLINLPLGLVAVIAALRWIPYSADPSAPRSIDWPGLSALTAGLFFLVFALNRANDLGWTSPVIVSLLAGGVAVLALFFAIERRRTAPLIDVTLFRNRTFLAGCLSAFMFSAAVFGSQPFTSLLMQNYLGFSPLQGGLAFLPATGLVAVLMPVSGILGQRLGHRVRLLIIAGSISVAISFAYLLTFTVESRYLDALLPAFILRGLGIGLVMSATSYAVVSALPVEKSGLASGTLTMARNIGTSAGVALFGSVYLHGIGQRLPERLLADGTDPAAADRLTEAATHFVPAGEGPAFAITSTAVVESFLIISLVGLVVCAAATAAAFLVRPRREPAPAAPAPAPMAAAPRTAP
ncbi:DHA2 family efflux MFS transporter permease subunit [Tepidiforma sp.]|uniref:DHA2 family efflux MFS transporter permease subunit n=1 Tax=Tepidiforma sp. TaxID=2682230 RepID=UPI002ADD6576|nr:DHA2 family efflux MFS transporter permease subunit [Tepidiforma sp.]